MNEIEAQMIVGTFVLFYRKGWPVADAKACVTAKEAIREGKRFPRRLRGKSHYYSSVYGSYLRDDGFQVVGKKPHIIFC